MIPLSVLTAFFIASVALSIAPGPDNIFVLTQSVLYGRRAGIMVLMGLCTGLLFHTTLVAFGAAFFFQDSEVAFVGLKIFGALYLLYLAWQLIKNPLTGLGGDGGQKLSGAALYLRGVVMSSSNPKLSIFFLAFLPQFVDPANGPMMGQFFLLGAVFIVAAILVFGLLVLLAGSVSRYLKRSPKTHQTMNWIAAGVLAVLAIHLMLDLNLV